MASNRTLFAETLDGLRFTQVEYAYHGKSPGNRVRYAINGRPISKSGWALRLKQARERVGDATETEVE